LQLKILFDGQSFSHKGQGSCSKLMKSTDRMHHNSVFEVVFAQIFLYRPIKYLLQSWINPQVTVD